MPAHRQILDGLEVMERKQVHHHLLHSLLSNAPGPAMDEMEKQIADHLAMPRAEKEARAEALFRELAVFTANAL